MASLDSMRKAEKQSSPNKDVELAVRMTIKLLRDGGGLNIIKDAIQQSKDPAQVIGQFLSQVAGQLAEKLDQEYGIDPRIFVSQGGWLEQVLDYIEKQLGLPEEFSDEISGAVLETMKGAAMGSQNAAQPQGQPAPQGAPPMAGGGLGG